MRLRRLRVVFENCCLWGSCEIMGHRAAAQLHAQEPLGCSPPLPSAPPPHHISVICSRSHHPTASSSALPNDPPSPHSPPPRPHLAVGPLPLSFPPPLPPSPPPRHPAHRRAVADLSGRAAAGGGVFRVAEVGGRRREAFGVRRRRRGVRRRRSSFRRCPLEVIIGDARALASPSFSGRGPRGAVSTCLA